MKNELKKIHFYVETWKLHKFSFRQMEITSRDFLCSNSMRIRQEWGEEAGADKSKRKDRNLSREPQG